jgi:NitT/TauT family transport system substrate-binding protein
MKTMQPIRLYRLAALLFVLPLWAMQAQAQQLETVRVGEGDKAVSPVFINMVVPEYLGYYKAEGVSVQVIPTGSQAAALAGVADGRLEVGAGTAGFGLQRLANDGTLPGKFFFENAYPFRYGVVVKPDSPYQTLADLKGKTIGVSSFGITVYPVVKGWFKLVGLDPDNDVKWLAVGEGATAGYALDRSDIDALAYYDTGFGQVEAAGIKIRYLPIPADAPRIGGAFFYATPAYIKEHRKTLIGFARAVLKAEVFIQTNPEAAAYIYAKLYPGAVPQGVPIQDQVNAVLVSIAKVAPSFTPYDKSAKWGFIKESELNSEIQFYNLGDKINDPKVVYTNDLINPINDFDWNKVKAEATNFKLPYKQ